MSFYRQLLEQLPPPGPARVGVMAALALGAAVAVGLTLLIAVFVVTAIWR